MSKRAEGKKKNTRNQNLYVSFVIAVWSTKGIGSPGELGEIENDYFFPHNCISIIRSIYKNIYPRGC